MENLWGGIEAGGTHFVCAVGTSPDDIHDRISFNTTSPEQTLNIAIDFFNRNSPIDAIGIGSFGPLDLDKNSSTYGTISSTPKEHWNDTNIVAIIKSKLKIPVFLDTDVNAALLAEYIWGNAKNTENAVYITVGTGIGGGAILNGKLIHGLIHPEMGHMKIPKNEDDSFKGICKYHGDCLEGLASGRAIEKRIATSTTMGNNKIWEFESKYLGIAIANLILTMSPERIIIGGGVMNHEGLIESIREQTLAELNNYVLTDKILDNINIYIQSPYLKDNAGVLGAILLAKQGSGNL